MKRRPMHAHARHQRRDDDDVIHPSVWVQASWSTVRVNGTAWEEGRDGGGGNPNHGGEGGDDHPPDAAASPPSGYNRRWVNCSVKTERRCVGSREQRRSRSRVLYGKAHHHHPIRNSHASRLRAPPTRSPRPTQPSPPQWSIHPMHSLLGVHTRVRSLIATPPMASDT